MVWNDAMQYVGFFVCQLVNESMLEGAFPETLKTSLITPIPKKTNTKKANEHRPINSMPIEEFFLECVVKNQLLEYLETNKIITEYQSAYRKKHSCESALNLIIFKCKMSIENGKVIIVVFLDLMRAFETIDRLIMLMKLKNYGIDNKELK